MLSNTFLILKEVKLLLLYSDFSYPSIVDKNYLHEQLVDFEEAKTLTSVNTTLSINHITSPRAVASKNNLDLAIV